MKESGLNMYVWKNGFPANNVENAYRRKDNIILKEIRWLVGSRYGRQLILMNGFFSENSLDEYLHFQYKSTRPGYVLSNKIYA